MMPPKKVRSVVVPKNKRTRQVTPVQVHQGPPAKRMHFNAPDMDIVMTITQPVDGNKPNKNSSKPKANPACSRVKEAGNSCSSVSLAHPPTRVQHACNAAPTLGQHQPSLQQPSPPWWACGPHQPPPQWNWNMWTPGAFQQLTASNTASHQQQLQMAMQQMLTASSTSQPHFQHTALPMSATIQQQGILSSPSSSCGTGTPPHASSAQKVSATDAAQENLDEIEETNPIVSTLSFTTAPGNPPKQLLSMHVSNSIKKHI